MVKMQTNIMKINITFMEETNKVFVFDAKPEDEVKKEV
jgi:hypothetical protein